MPACFAYGSKLSVTEMLRRCPGATNPRPATLADHDWLVNRRGVATIEPFAGSTVHGVVWDVSDRDLVALDADAGVPSRCRRDRLTVHTSEGPADTWVYLDDCVEAGAPQPEYLSMIIDAAVCQRLPPRWIEFLRRWDPATWPLPTTLNGDGPQSFSELLRQPGVVEESRLRSRFGFLAIHGGGLEQMTDVIAQRAADAARASVYVVRHPDQYPHHLPSSRFRVEESPMLAMFLDHVDVVVSLHGFGRIGRSTELLAGGRNRRLAAHLARHLALPGYQLVTDLDAIPAELRGLYRSNPVNRTRGGGVQLELPARIRGMSPRSQPPGDDGLPPATSVLVGALAAAARAWT